VSGNAGSGNGSAREKRVGVRDALLVLLTIASGAVDAVCFFGLGEVFTSVMTGNLVLLGLAAGQGEASEAMRAGVAVAGYIVAAFVVARWLPHATESDPWPTRITFVATGEWVLQAAVAGVWVVVGAAPSPPVALGLIVAYSLAMGSQSAIARALAVPGVTTTYVTGTLTGVLGDLGRRDSDRWSKIHRIAVVAAVLVGAGATATILHFAPLAAPLLPLTLTTAVVAIGFAVFHRRSVITHR
jgi:uncharacterized membrane protein YoaK (UPF0700 family)